MASNFNASGRSDSDQECGSGTESPPLPHPVHDGLPQTGPKGVLTDYYRTQEMDKRKEILAQEKRKKLIEKHSATVQSYSDEQAAENKLAVDDTAITNLAKAFEGGTLDEDPFLQQYRAKRLEELKQQGKKGKMRQRFGHLVEVRGDKYDTYIDNVLPQTFVVMHIYDEILPVCQHMNKCLTPLAKVYPTVKFCRVQAGQVGVSPAFVGNGLPALLVYRGGDLVGNLLRVTDSLGEAYTMEELEGFLQEKHCLPPESDKEEIPNLPGSARGVLGIPKKLSSSDSD